MKKWGYHILVFLLSWPSFAQSTLLWDESVNGLFSIDYRTPTPLGALNIGTNTILGEVELIPDGGYWLVIADCFQYDVVAGMQMNEMRLTTDGMHVQIWLGATNYSNQLGSKHDAINGDILPQMGLQPLGSSPYKMYVANHDAQDYTSIAHYRLDFIVTSIPEPSTVVILTSAGLWLLFLNWRKTRRFLILANRRNE